MTFFVVIPMYNEASYILSSLQSLESQSDTDFGLVLVDNGSSDSTLELVQEFISQTSLTVYLITETQKGTGAASDTGFRYAIDLGATHIARTDADCIPHPDWVCNLKSAFQQKHLEFIGGVIRPRSDEGTLRLVDKLLIPILLVLADISGWIRRRGKENQYAYFMAAGNNLAITSNLYIQSGGFPRSCIEDLHEDRELSEKVRKLTPHGARVHNIIVYNSLRRLRSYGYLNTILWYWDHHYQPDIVDVR